MTVWRFDTPGEVTVRVRGKAGSVEVVTHDRATTEVEVTALDPSADDAVEQTVVEQTVVEQTTVEEEEPAGGRHSIRVEVPGVGAPTGSGGFLRRVISMATDGPKVRIVVHCPVGSDLDVTTASAPIDGIGRFGSVETKTASGDTTLPHVSGELRVRTASGDVSVEGADAGVKIETASGDVKCGVIGGEATITTASGDVMIDEARCAVSVRTASGDVRLGEAVTDCEIQTASGDQDIRRASTGVVTLESVSGDLRIGIARGTAVKVDGQSVSGDLRSEIDLDADPVDPGPDGPGSTLDLKMRTVSGDASVRRA